MIKKCGYMFRKFAESIKNLSEEEREKYIQRFEKLISLKYDLICNILNKKTWFCGDRKLEYLFKKENLDAFTDETYSQAIEEQLELINRCLGNKFSKETRDRLNNLMIKRNFSNYLCNFDLMMRLYTDEELETLDSSVSRAIDNFSQTEESLNKIIDFIQRRPDLAEDIVYMSEDRFMKTDNFTLIEVCDHIDCVYAEDIDYNLATVAVKPKVLLKRVFSAYNKKDTK